MMDFLKDLDAKMTESRTAQNEAGIGTLSGLAKMLKGPATDAGTGKLPLTILPAGVQPGQRVSLTVTGIDPITGMATVVPDAVQEAVPPAPPSSMAQQPDAVDRELTMGPMDDLRAYLSSKTREQQESQ